MSPVVYLQSLVLVLHTAAKLAMVGIHVQVQVLVEGTYPVLLVNLPRSKDALFVECAQAAAAA